MKLANEPVVIETKNDTVVNGTIAGVDPQMNIHLKNVKVTAKNKQAQSMDHLTLRGHTIRIVMLPESIPLDTYLTDDGAKKRGTAKTGAGRGRGGRGRGVNVKKK